MWTCSYTFVLDRLIQNTDNDKGLQDSLMKNNLSIHPKKETVINGDLNRTLNNMLSVHQDQEHYSEDGVFVIPELREESSLSDNSNSKVLFRKLLNLKDSNSICNAGSIEYGSKSLNRRSLCPFQRVIDQDSDRIPQSIATAKCMCSKCRGLEQSSFICEEIKYTLMVKRKSSNAWYQYKINSGCVCAAPRY